jgi:hypothetical protein
VAAAMPGQPDIDPSYLYENEYELTSIDARFRRTMPPTMQFQNGSAGLDTAVRGVSKPPYGTGSGAGIAVGATRPPTAGRCGAAVAGGCPVVSMTPRRRFRPRHGLVALSELPVAKATYPACRYGGDAISRFVMQVARRSFSRVRPGWPAGSVPRRGQERLAGEE